MIFDLWWDLPHCSNEWIHECPGSKSTEALIHNIADIDKENCNLLSCTLCSSSVSVIDSLSVELSTKLCTIRGEGPPYLGLWALLLLPKLKTLKLKLSLTAFILRLPKLVYFNFSVIVKNSNFNLLPGGGLLGSVQPHRACQQTGGRLRLLALQGGSQAHVGGREVNEVQWRVCSAPPDPCNHWRSSKRARGGFSPPSIWKYANLPKNQKRFSYCGPP